MNTNTFVKPNGQPDLTAAIWRRMLQVVVQFLILAAILFVAAGRLDWGMAWAYLGVYVGIIVINMLVLLRVSPELIAERGQIRQDAKEWDKWFGGIVSLIGPLTTLLVAGLNARFGWPPTLAPAIQLAALAGMALGYGFSGWAMASNKFFAGLVRIQTERGHTVASGGPYRYVRHPGYSGWSLAYLVTPLVLGSVWALIPAALTVAVLIVRTALEDRTLQEELDGYKDYAQRVRYRLLPGIW